MFYYKITFFLYLLVTVIDITELIFIKTFAFVCV